jgi:hypothetical protein
MNENKTKSLKFSFLTTFVLPALLIFLVPVISYFFFTHAQIRFNTRMRESILTQIRNDGTINEEQRKQAIALFSEVPLSSARKRIKVERCS